MAECLIVHPDLTNRGGAEAVCMNVLAALQEDHHVELLTLSEPSFARLNDFYDTAVDDVDVRKANLPRLADRATGDRLGLLTVALLNRSLRRIADRFDLVVSTYNEFSVPIRSVQYLHHPNFDRSVIPEAPGGGSDLYGAYDRVCRLVSGVERDRFDSAVLLANSRWTASRMGSILGTCPDVVYPPVDVTGFENTSWDEREPGFVTIGRLDPSKNHLRTIEVVTALRERGHDVHLHVVGASSDTAPDYRRRVLRAASERPFVHLEGAVGRERLVELVSTHRYGIHGKDYEHFGMAVAELVAGGAVPFVPDGGGQREIVGDRDALTYASTGEAVERIDEMLSDPSLQRAVREDLPDVADRFNRDRFRERFRTAVEDALS